MAKLSVRAPAKINLHLEVLGQRPDGFHELAMVMQTLNLEDRLYLDLRSDATLTLSSDRSDLPVDGNNLIVKAADRLRHHVDRLHLGATMRLEKRIPIGAGLAGGSSDAAAALVGLDALWDLRLDRSELLHLSAELGSDVPYCLAGGTQLCFGRGELLEPLPLPEPLPLGVLLIKHPDVSVSTPWAYGLCRLRRQATYVEGESAFEQRRQALRQGPLLAALQGQGPWPPLRNDLQTVVEPEVACVRQGLELLRQAPGSVAVAMSGSGPSLFALFSTMAKAERALEHLATPLNDAGFEAWCCRCSGSGVSLDTVAAAEQ